MIRVMAAALGGGSMGFTAGLAGSADPDEYQQVPIKVIATNPQFNGIFAFDLDPVISPPQDIFRELRIGGLTLRSADAYYIQAQASWVWFDTGLNFEPGSEHLMVVVG
jgi:hypothetical protein